jgi:hypothetical protein
MGHAEGVNIRGHYDEPVVQESVTDARQGKIKRAGSSSSSSSDEEGRASGGMGRKIKEKIPGTTENKAAKAGMPSGTTGIGTGAVTTGVPATGHSHMTGPGQGSRIATYEGTPTEAGALPTTAGVGGATGTGAGHPGTHSAAGEGLKAKVPGTPEYKATHPTSGTHTGTTAGTGLGATGHHDTTHDAGHKKGLVEKIKEHVPGTTEHKIHKAEKEAAKH